MFQDTTWNHRPAVEHGSWEKGAAFKQWAMKTWVFIPFSLFCATFELVQGITPVTPNHFCVLSFQSRKSKSKHGKIRNALRWNSILTARWQIRFCNRCINSFVSAIRRRAWWTLRGSALQSILPLPQHARSNGTLNSDEIWQTWPPVC